MTVLSARLITQRAPYTAAAANLNAARCALGVVEAQLSRAQGQIHDVDTRTGLIKAALAEVRDERQDYDLGLDGFRQALQHYEALDPRTDRRQILHQLSDASEDVDTCLRSAAALLRRGD